MKNEPTLAIYGFGCLVLFILFWVVIGIAIGKYLI